MTSLSLHPDHLRDLRNSGLTDETIAQAGLYSVRPGDIRKVTGVQKVESMLAFPYTPDFTRYKVFPTNLKAGGRKFRYTQPPGSGVHVYIPPATYAALAVPQVKIGIAEGEKKALKSCQEGIPCIGLGGLWNWLDSGRLLPELKAMSWKGRQVTLYPDSDVWKRQDLLEAVYRLGCALEAEGAIVTVCALPGGAGQTKQGLDDYLLTHSPAELAQRPHLPLTHDRFDHARKKAAARDQYRQAKGPTRRGKKLRDLMAQVFPVPRAIVPNIVLEGTMVFAGKPKLGKSRLMLDMAIATACGGKALGHIPVDSGPVLYLSLEDPERRLQARAQAMLAGCQAPEQFEYETSWPRLDEGGLADLELWIQEHPGARLIVIDTLKRIRPKDKKGQSLYDADYEALQGLTDLAHRHEGLAIVVVHHTNKMREVEDFADLISGSTGLQGSVDGFAVLRRKRGDAMATLAVVHRDLPEDQEHALESDELTGGWTFAGPVSEQASSPEQRLILEVLKESVEPMTSNGIAEVIGKKPDAVRFLLHKMHHRGLVDKAATGRYTLPSSTTNTTNTANSTNTLTPLTDVAVSATAREGPPLPSATEGEASLPPPALVALVVDEETANAHQPAPAMGSHESVSGVSDVSDKGLIDTPAPLQVIRLAKKLQQKRAPWTFPHPQRR